MDLSQWGIGLHGSEAKLPVEDNAGATDDSTSLGWLRSWLKKH